MLRHFADRHFWMPSLIEWSVGAACSQTVIAGRTTWTLLCRNRSFRFSTGCVSRSCFTAGHCCVTDSRRRSYLVASLRYRCIIGKGCLVPGTSQLPWTARWSTAQLLPAEARRSSVFGGRLTRCWVAVVCYWLQTIVQRRWIRSLVQGQYRHGSMIARLQDKQSSLDVAPVLVTKQAEAEVELLQLFLYHSWPASAIVRLVDWCFSKAL